MRRPTAVTGLTFFFTAFILMGCSDQPAPTEAQRMTHPGSALMAAGPSHAGAIIGHDACNPASFNAALGDPNACVNPGNTTFEEFIAELTATHTARKWNFNPLQATTHAGDALLVQNVGGEVHTFTPVRHFGGGLVAPLNALSGNLVPAAECLNVPGLDFVPGGGKSLISGAALAAVTDADGIARVECCIHPWMRTEVRVK